MFQEYKNRLSWLIVLASAFAGVALGVRLASYEDVSWIWAAIAIWLGGFTLYLKRQI